jgi:hypothetical protein
LSEGKKRGQIEERGGFIGEGLMAITARNYRGINSGRFQERERGCRSGYRKVMTGGLHLSLGRREGAYRFGFLAPGGQWAACGTGPKFIPEALFLFSFLFFFSFSVFLFL